MSDGSYERRWAVRFLGSVPPNFFSVSDIAARACCNRS